MSKHNGNMAYLLLNIIVIRVLLSVQICISYNVRIKSDYVNCHITENVTMTS